MSIVIKNILTTHNKRNKIIFEVLNVKKKVTNCESCVNFVYDEELGCEVCMVNLDEDEYLKYMESSFDSCPYYQLYDEYKTVRRQN